MQNKEFTHDELIQMNKDIAKMMFPEHDFDNRPVKVSTNLTTEAYLFMVMRTTGEFNFNRSWDWLMLAAEKIDERLYEVIYNVPAHLQMHHEYISLKIAFISAYGRLALGKKSYSPYSNDIAVEFDALYRKVKAYNIAKTIIERITNEQDTTNTAQDTTQHDSTDNQSTGATGSAEQSRDDDPGQAGSGES